MNSSRWILLVDDDREDREIISDAFADLGLQALLHFEDNGEKALRYLDECLAKQNLPGIIVLDLNMPRLNGTQTLRLLKQHAVLKSIPVIIYSTSLNHLEKNECMAIGAHDFLIKPISYKDTLKVAERFYALSLPVS